MAAESTMSSATTARAPLTRGYTTPGGPAARPKPARRRSPRTRAPPSQEESPAAQPPGWARDVLRAALGESRADAPAVLPVQAVPDARLRRGDVVRAAVRVVRAQKVPDAVLRDARVPAALVALLADESVFASANDRVAIVAAIHALATSREARDALVAADALSALVNIAREADARASQDILRARSSVRPPLWGAAVRAIAKLTVCSTSACAEALPSGALALLATAAAPEEPIEVRVRASAGLAAIAAWSGPRLAVAIVETPGVVRAMSAILTERDDTVSNHLRSATMDALVAMSFHRRARRILREQGCDGKISAAAKHASISGDYDIAARGTIAAGQVTGHSVDEFGFLVQGESSPATAHDDEDENGCINSVGLKRIQELMLHEAYMQVEEIEALETLVNEDTQGETSSRDQQLVREAARMYGVDPSTVAQKMPLEQAGSPTSVTDSSSRRTSQEVASAEKSGNSNRSAQSGLLVLPAGDSAAFLDAESRLHSHSASQVGAATDRVASASHLSTPSRGSPDTNSAKSRKSGSSPGVTGENADPDEDQDAISPDSVSPLMAFSKSTMKAAERDGGSALLKKSTSQISRDVEHERFWSNIIENHPHMLVRETGTRRRVKAYQQLVSVPIPSPLRRTLWPMLLDVEEARQAEPGLYDELCHRGEEEALNDETEHTIEADVTRTMPLHALFWSGGAQVGVKSLRSILRAYALYRPEVGYCQGMSSVAAVFMMNAKHEEDAFLMFVQFMKQYNYMKVFEEGFPKMLQWMTELRREIFFYMPELWNRLESENVPLELYADKWLITALSHNFPHRYLLRVWDLMFLGGSTKIILKSCMACLQMAEPRLMTMHFDGMMGLLQRDFATPEAGILDLKDPEPFLKMARNFRFDGTRPAPPAQSAVSTSIVPPAPRNDLANVHRAPRASNTAPRQKIGCFASCFRSPQRYD